MSQIMVGSVEHVTSHILRIEFNDGHISVMDFAPFIFGNGHPDYDKYKNVDHFLEYDIVDGNLNWDDYTMIFPIEDLYRNSLIKK